MNPKISVTLGKRFIPFDHRTPEIGREIIYLLGNGITGIQEGCQLVRGIYDPTFGDFAQDEGGRHEFVTHWSTIPEMCSPWIPVAESLPDTGKDVLLYHVHHAILLGLMNSENIFKAYYKGHPIEQKGITHWMPLPEHP